MEKEKTQKPSIKHQPSGSFGADLNQIDVGPLSEVAEVVTLQIVS